VKMGAQDGYCVPDRYFSLIQWWRVRRSEAERDGELLTGLISCECGVEKGREQLLQPSAEHIQHLHSHTESRSIGLTTHTHTCTLAVHSDSHCWLQRKKGSAFTLSKVSQEMASLLMYCTFIQVYAFSTLFSAHKPQLSFLTWFILSYTFHKSGTIRGNASILHSFPIWLFVIHVLTLWWSSVTSDRIQIFCFELLKITASSECYETWCHFWH